MEDLAGYASMGAAAVALDAGLLFTSDDESYRSHAFAEPNYFHKKLTSVKRFNEDEDDMTISLLTTVWQDELVACIAEKSNLSRKPVSGSVPQSHSKTPEGHQNLPLAYRDHSLIQNAKHFTSGVLGKRQRITELIPYVNGFRTNAGYERKDSGTLGIQMPDTGIKQNNLGNQQSTLLNLQNSMWNRQRELINQIRQTNERLENQFRLQNGFDIGDPEQCTDRESQVGDSEPH